MNKKELSEIKEELTKTLRVIVNGKIDNQHRILEGQNAVLATITKSLSEHMDASQAHWIKSNLFMEELLPVRDALLTIRNVNKFIKWLGIPSLVAFITWMFVK